MKRLEWLRTTGLSLIATSVLIVAIKGTQELIGWWLT